MAVYMVCDKCGNDTWYIVGSKPYEDMPAYQIQLCSKCGFAVKVTYEIKEVKFLEPEELLKELKSNLTLDWPIDRS